MGADGLFVLGLGLAVGCRVALQLVAQVVAQAVAGRTHVIAEGIRQEIPMSVPAFPLGGEDLLAAFGQQLFGFWRE